jgi:hypothetical protein
MAQQRKASPPPETDHDRQSHDPPMTPDQLSATYAEYKADMEAQLNAGRNMLFHDPRVMDRLANAVPRNIGFFLAELKGSDRDFFIAEWILNGTEIYRRNHEKIYRRPRFGDEFDSLDEAIKALKEAFAARREAWIKVLSDEP